MSSFHSQLGQYTEVVDDCLTSVHRRFAVGRSVLVAVAIALRVHARVASQPGDT